MILRDLRRQFKRAIPISDAFFELMRETFGFYSTLCNEFFTSLGSDIESNSLTGNLQNTIRPKLFSAEHCKNLEAIKKRFLTENIKLEQFIAAGGRADDLVNDLVTLKKVGDSVYELLQTHWEFFKYEKSVANNEAIVAFILEVDRIGINWTLYLEKRLAISTLLKTIKGETRREGVSPLLIQYHLPESTVFTLEMSACFIQFLSLVFDFMKSIHEESEEETFLEIANLEGGDPIDCVLMVPNLYISSFSRFLGYLSVDIIKRETLVKYVLEIVRLRQGKELPKTAITSFQKKIAKQLNELPSGGYFTIKEDDTDDSVKLLKDLCDELDRLNVQYKDMLTSSTDKLARNRLKPLSQLSEVARKIEPESEKGELAVKKPTSPLLPEENKKKRDGDSERKSTVKIDIKNKEHIQYLTSR